MQVGTESDSMADKLPGNFARRCGTNTASACTVPIETQPTAAKAFNSVLSTLRARSGATDAVELGLCALLARTEGIADLSVMENGEHASDSMEQQSYLLECEWQVEREIKWGESCEAVDKCCPHELRRVPSPSVLLFVGYLCPDAVRRVWAIHPWMTGSLPSSFQVPKLPNARSLHDSSMCQCVDCGVARGRHLARGPAN